MAHPSRPAPPCPAPPRLPNCYPETVTDLLCAPTSNGLLTYPLQISCEFDSGNIEVVDDTTPSEGLGVQLKIRPDVYTELEKKSHLQW